MRPIFIVGTPRSGTTLLQALFAARKDTFTLPELWIFRLLRARTRTQALLNRAGFVAPSRKEALFARLREASGEQVPTPPGFRLRKVLFHYYAQIARMAEGRDVWVEKTPLHIYHLDEIRRWLPHARILLIRRNRDDVLRSWLVAARRDPDTWLKQVGMQREHSADGSGAFRTDDLYQRVARLYDEHRRIPEDLVDVHVRYERLVSEPGEELRRMCAALELPFDPRMLDHASYLPPRLREDLERSPDWANAAMPLRG